MNAVHNGKPVGYTLLTMNVSVEIMIDISVIHQVGLMSILTSCIASL